MKRLALSLLTLLFGFAVLAAGCGDEDPPPPRKYDQTVIYPDAGAKQDK